MLNVVLLLVVGSFLKLVPLSGDVRIKAIRKDGCSSLFARLLGLYAFWGPSFRTAQALPNSGIHQRRKSSFAVLPNQLNSIIFLGDSLIQTCEWAELVGPFTVKNRGISGDTISMVLDRLPQVTKSQPSQLFLMIGINDLRHKKCDVETVLQQYALLLKTIQQTSPNTQVLVHSVLPIHREMFERRFQKDGQHINHNVVRFNQDLEALVDRYSAQYINLTPLLTDKSGQLQALYTVDGIHLSGEAYEVWVKHLQPFLKGSSIARGAK